MGSATSGLPPTLLWQGGADGALLLLDQTLLPSRVRYRRCITVEHVWQAIRELCVRGAPAIGVAAAYGLYLGGRAADGLPTGRREARPTGRLEARPTGRLEACPTQLERRLEARPTQLERLESPTQLERLEDCPTLLERIHQVAAYLISARPTAVNLEWAVRRVQRRAEHEAGAAQDDSAAVLRAMLAEAHAIRDEDVAACRRIGEHGAGLIPEGGGVLTHCNAGALATVAYGTALAPLYVAHERGRRFRVYADETRPLLQGARLTAFELAAAGIDVTVLCDGAAASLMRSGKVSLVITGADRIAANGDVANKIGTYGLALAAKRHGIPFYVAAPLSTFDLSLASGEEIEIEQRGADEVWGAVPGGAGPAGAGAWNPAFDVTPADIIRGIVTEKGVLEPVTVGNIAKIFLQGGCKGG